MKNVLMLSTFILCFCLSILGQDVDQLPMITVTGTAQIMVAPDEVVFSLDVTKLNADLQLAKTSNDLAVGKVLELTRKFKVAPQDVKTDSISLQMKFERTRDPGKKLYDDDGEEISTKRFIGYQVSKTIAVRLKDLSRFEEFFSEVLKTGITEVNFVRFETSAIRENKDKARDQAMKAAREKAIAMSASIGQKIGKAVKINEGNIVNQNTYSANYSNTLSVGSTFSQGLATFAPGAIKVEAQVTVSFILN